MDLTKDQLDTGFVHQVRMYQGVGRERMHLIVDILFDERVRGKTGDQLETSINEELRMIVGEGE